MFRRGRASGRVSRNPLSGNWCWTDDRPLTPKQVVTLLMTFFSPAEIDVTPQVPSLTMPVN
jgi:hypothetical protein